ncbi:hypothetical protein A4G19_03920 [Pasteurellaceae bacterium Macca]|nr:hypothetical protein [Pasteurellaceae bacterium Macca]
MSVLLRTGDLKDYTALGQDGRAVYMIAPQIRDTIKIKRGKSFTDYLAIPQRNETGNTIDWYIPFQPSNPEGSYLIVPWTAATDDEKSKALLELDFFKNHLTELGKELNKLPNLQGDQLLFSRLLYSEKLSENEQLKTIRFPNQEYVYLVDGKPVITFWGFTEKHQHLTSDPFLCLRPPKPINTQPTITNVSTATVETISKRPFFRHWCFWVGLIPLLLLFLGLLGWWLGWFLKLPSLNMENSLVTQTANAVEKETCQFYWVDNQWRDDNGNLIKTVPSYCKPTVQQSVPYYQKDGKWYSVNGHLINDSALLSYLAQGQSASSAISSNPMNDNQAVPENSAISSNPNEVQNPEENKDATPPVDPTTSNLNPPKGTENTENSPSANEPLIPESNEQSSGKNSPSDTVDNSALSPTKLQNQNMEKNQPLALNSKQLASGKTDFLNGNWNAGAGIQDKASGKPLKLNYQFNNGKGTVQLKRADGVACQANVQASIQNGGLNINNTDVANCSDGSTYQLPAVICQPGTTGSADCRGKYGNQQFPMTIKSN